MIIWGSPLLVYGCAYLYLTFAPNPYPTARLWLQGFAYNYQGELLDYGVVRYQYRLRGQPKDIIENSSVNNGYFGINVEVFELADVESFAITGVWRSGKNLLPSMLPAGKTSLLISPERLYMKKSARRDPFQLTLWEGHPVKWFAQQQSERVSGPSILHSDPQYH